MKFRLIFSLDKDIKHFHPKLNELSMYVEKKFEKLTFGEDVEELYVGIQCVSPKFEKFFKPRKPKYVGDKVNYEKEGKVYCFQKMFEYEIMVEYDKLIHASENEVIENLANLLLDSSFLIKKEKNIKNFNFNLFHDTLSETLNEYITH